MKHLATARLQGEQGTKLGKEASQGDRTSVTARRAQAALSLLLDAAQAAHDLGRSVWDFAVEIHDLREAPLTNNDLRWLVCKGFVDHAREIPSTGQQSRSFRPGGGLAITKRTCCVLTKAGEQFAQEALAQYAQADGVSSERQGVIASLVGGPKKPTWDAIRQELRVDTVIVKRFKLPAGNQVKVLAAFEEEGWPYHILDPLPPEVGKDPKRRLHDTIMSLNRRQKHRLVRFFGDGTGQGVHWSLVHEPARGRDSLSSPKQAKPA